MRAARDVVVTDLSEVARGDYGGRPYGLEPLTLPFWDPHAREPSADPSPTSPPHGDLAATCAELDSLARGRAPAARPGPAPTPSPLYWFRWITGHQVSFILWQLIGRSLARLEDSPDRRDCPLGTVAGYVRGYSAMLLYCASCPRQVYSELIRPSMFLQHPAFSGAWAPDYAAVRRLMRGRRTPDGDPDAVRRLEGELDVNRIVHRAVARKLVPNGQSLFEAASGGSALPAQRMLSVLYDNYFMTLRSPVAGEAIVAQLLRRLYAIGLDLSDNGLYPDTPAPGDDAGAPWEPEVRECERDLPALLVRLAADAVAGLGDHADPPTLVGPQA
jgi:L-tyrosine peroxygenase